MADIRINALATTAASTASDDFVAVDGSANGTRKLNAYSPTFGGNLTVSGGTVDITSASSAKISGSTAGSSATLSLISNTAANYRSLQFGYGATPTYLWKIGYNGATSNDQLNFESGTGTVAQLTQAGALTLSSNLTVSGTGTSSFAGSLLQRSSTGVGAIASIGTDTYSYSVLRVQNTAVSGRSFDIGTAGSGDATLGSKLYIYDNTAGAARWTMDSSGNIAQTGNLTVSGTGTSSVAGNLFVGTTTAAASGARLQAQLTGTDGTVSTLLSLRKNTNAAGTGVAIDFTPDSTDNPLAKLSAVRTSLVSGYTDFRFSTWNGSAFTEQLRLVGQTGNLLLKTDGIDSGNGKLQLATHTDNTGGIGFGTDVSLYRTAAGAITVSSDGVSFTTFTPSGTYQQQIYRSGADAQFRLTRGGVRDWDLVGGSTFQIKADGTTALTLDSSLNATFARQVLAGAGFVLGWNGRGHLIAPSDGVITLLNAASNDFNRLQFGGTTASFPSLKRSTSVLTCVLADDSAFATFRALDFSAQGAATTVGANQVSYGGTTATTATAGAQTLPANPVGFIIVNVAGTTAKIPYYAN